MGDDQTGVERRPDAVPGEVADHAVAEPLGVRLDRSPDDVDLAARRDRLDAAGQALPGAVDQRGDLFARLADDECRLLSPCTPFLNAVMSMLTMSPSSSTVSSGMPWQITSLTELHSDFGKPR